MPRDIKPNRLIDTLITEQRLKHGYALSTFLDVLPSTITKIRKGQVVTGDLMIRIHERTGMSIARIKELAGQA